MPNTIQTSPTKPENTPWIAELSGDGFYRVVNTRSVVLAQKCVKEEAVLFAATPELLKTTRYLRLVCEDRLSDLREERERLEPSDEEGWYDDIDERIEHYELLLSDAKQALAKAYGTAE